MELLTFDRYNSYRYNNRYLKNSANEATKDIVAAYTKPSKEVVLVTASVGGREALEARKEWASLKYGSAEVRRQTFPVAVYRVRRSGVDKKR